MPLPRFSNGGENATYPSAGRHFAQRMRTAELPKPPEVGRSRRHYRRPEPTIRRAVETRTCWRCGRKLGVWDPREEDQPTTCGGHRRTSN